MEFRTISLSLALTIILITCFSISNVSAQGTHPPNWVDKISLWWSEGKISDKEFVNAFSYLSSNKIIVSDGLDYGQKTSFVNKLQQTKTLASYLSKDSHKIIPVETSNTLVHNSEQTLNAPVENNVSFRNLPPSGITNYFVYVEPFRPLSINQNVSLEDAMNYWNQHDDVNFKLVSDPQEASVIIRWIKESNSPYSAYTVSNNLIEIGLGDSKCNGIWHPYDSDFITSLLTHELGHVLGYRHNNNPTSIMYPFIQNAKYAPFNDTLILNQNQPVFVSACTFNDITSFHFRITDNSKNKFNAFFVDSKNQYLQSLSGHEFSYYDQDGCNVSGANSFDGLCKNVSSNSGIIIQPIQASNQNVTVFMEEER